MTCLSNLDKKTLEFIRDMLRKEWYALNDADRPQDETPRDIGLRVGRKTQLNKNIHEIAELIKSL